MDFMDGFLVSFFGAVGGLGNGLISKGVIELPKIVVSENGTKQIEPGILGLIVLGVIASWMYFGLVGTPGLDSLRIIGLSLLAGIGSSSFITAVMEQQLNKVLKVKVSALTGVSKDAVNKLNVRDSKESDTKPQKHTNSDDEGAEHDSECTSSDDEEVKSDSE
jgi:hypothetical protein